MVKNNVLSRVLNQVRLLRQMEREEVENDIWARNGLVSAESRKGHKILSETRVSQSGEERTKFQLWKLIDEAELVITTQVTSEIKTREEKPKNVEPNRTPPADNSASPI